MPVKSSLLMDEMPLRELFSIFSFK